ncbi:MAG: glycosyltransferase family 4 protein [Candidatus Thiodiazotropha sp. (ex Lucinoma borealis)]|nr:glycosyltransferase family 4 protein [Candidatus Thiodiazotropha sp. (ex Lucinoma borealis)]
MKKEKIKVCLLHSTLHIGGAEEVTANICKTIDKDKFDVTVCFLKEMGKVGERIKENGTRIIGIKQKNKGKTDYFTSLKLRKILHENKFQIVHSHDIHSLVDSSLCRLITPSLRLLHTFHYGNYPNREADMARLERLFWRIPDRLVAVANKQKQDICDYYKIPNSRITTVWNGVDITHNEVKLDILDEYKSQGKIIIGSINTLIEQKGMYDLIKVAKLLKAKIPEKFVFVIAGDGHLRKKLEDEIVSNKLEQHVKLLGWIDSASSVLLPQIDIFFQPSLWEAMSMVLLEAMASGKPVVTTSVGETPKIIEDSKYGVIVNPGAITDMYSSLEALILDDNERARYGKLAKKRYEETFTATNMSRRYESIYETLARV